MEKRIRQARTVIMHSDAILIGASNGLSISEGYNIFADNKMFNEQFGDFKKRYGIRSVLDGIFAKHMSIEDHRQFAQRLVSLWCEEYQPTTVMNDLRTIVSGKPCFVLTTNADEHLEKAGFPASDVWEIEGTFRDIVSGKSPQDKQPVLNDFLSRFHDKNLVILELGIGSRNRLIKLPLMQLAMKESNATYITLNLPHEIYVPDEIAEKSIALSGDIAETLKKLRL